MVKSASGRGRNAEQSRPSSHEAARPGIDPQTHDTLIDQAPASDEIVVRDERRRGWYWHWNSVPNQAGPLLTYTGIGLLDHYTVLTDRRPDSPRHGYAYPSLDSIAADFGLERGDVIALNKILQTLELIEIKKEMVSRPSEDGKNYRTLVNLYKVIDRSDGYDLTAKDVMKVVRLAEKNAAVHRRIRHIFRSRFPQLDLDGVWEKILPELRRDPLWQQFAARAAEEEARASDRSRRGHQNRKSLFDASTAVDDAAAPSDEKDSGAVIAAEDAGTGVAPSNPGLTTGVEPSNGGSQRSESTEVAPGNDAPPTSVEPSNTTYHLLSSSTTTTSSGDAVDEPGNVSRPAVTPSEDLVNAPVSPVERAAPDDGPSMERAIRNFEEANSNRPATAAQRRRLAELAARFDAEAKRQAPGSSGWRWIAAAIDDGVDSGSTYMAPRRIETILTRWAEEGAPERAGGGVVRLADTAAPRRPREPEPDNAPEPIREPAPEPDSAWEPAPVPIAAAPFVIDECGMLSTQFWSMAQEDLVASRKLTRGECDACLRPVRIAGRGERNELILLAPNSAVKTRLERRKINADVRAACALILGREVGLIIHVAPTGPGPAGLPGVDDLPARAD